MLESQNYAIEDKNAVDHLDKYAHEKYSKDRSSRYDRGGNLVMFIHLCRLIDLKYKQSTNWPRAIYLVI